MGCSGVRFHPRSTVAAGVGAGLLRSQEHRDSLKAATCYVSTLNDLNRFEEAKTLSRRSIPVARRTLGNSDHLTLQMKSNYAIALCKDDGATLDDLREAVTTLEETERTARRVLGSAHPVTMGIEHHLRKSRATLRARETPSTSG